MIQKLGRRLQAASDLLSPRTLLRTLARVDTVADTTRDLTMSVEALRIRTEQLETIVRLDWEQQDELALLGTVLDAERIRHHVERAVASAPLTMDPFPHLVVDNWLPPDVYEAMLRAVPPAIFFANREVVRQRMTVPFAFAPSYSRRVWTFVSEEVVGRIVSDALGHALRGAVRAYVEQQVEGPVDEADLRLHPSDGRIMLRRPGYVIRPHRDPKWGFVTGLVYLARSTDHEAYGTQLYRVAGDIEAPTGGPFYVDESCCELIRAVPFRPNTLLAFLNSSGAHGASIPADAEPASLERYVYQFRLGPDSAAIRRLLALMPPHRRAQWTGTKSAGATSGYQA